VTEYLQHAFGLTAHTIQGGTVEWAGVVGHPEDFTRNWSLKGAKNRVGRQAASR
jgi:hypothetical protein